MPHYTQKISEQMWNDGGYQFACDECGATEDIAGYRSQDGSIFILCAQHDELADDCPRVGDAGEED